MQTQTALVLGATGLIGTTLVKLLLEDESFEKVKVLVRRQFDMQHQKLIVESVDFDNANNFKEKIGKGDVIFCCIGTTLTNMNGDKVAYRKVDYDIAVNAAKFGLAAGYKKYLLVSSVGAKTSAANFYLHLKGEIEEAITALPFKRIDIFQPSILLGKRKEFRLGELIGKGVMQTVSFLFFGASEKYKAVTAVNVAKAMVAASKKMEEEITTHQYPEIIQLSKSIR
jgi:uncharacterized protein YbjT (DUF2867 family)